MNTAVVFSGNTHYPTKHTVIAQGLTYEAAEAKCNRTAGYWKHAAPAKLAETFVVLRTGKGVHCVPQSVFESCYFATVAAMIEKYKAKR